MHKYHAKKTVVNGITFDSKAEAKRYRELLIMQEAGEIDGLELQPLFLLVSSFKCRGKSYRDIRYIADFLYRETATNTLVVEDVKGVETEVFKIKKKLFLKKYGEAYEFRIIK